MTRETCGPMWWPSFFLTSFNRGRGIRYCSLITSEGADYINGYVIKVTKQARNVDREFWKNNPH